MTTSLTSPDAAALVAAAQAGDADAWGELVARFQDAAVALAVGHGHWSDADDVAQEAFMLAMQHIASLTDPRAFPGWFAALVRTASSRRRRSARPTVPMDEADAGADVADPADDAERSEAIDTVRAAVESLPPHERAVIALHHLGGLAHRQVADFLGISEAAAKKRAWNARHRLKELLPMVTNALSSARPSRSQRFRDTVLLFAAIRDRDVQHVRALLAGNPDLVHAREDWSFEEGVAAQLGHAAAASPLIRAAATGSLEVVRVLVDAGAPVNDLCECAGSESALWTAVSLGFRDIVDHLLARGADPNATAFAGATPLHAAVLSGHHDLVGVLVDAGADPDKTDDHGRRASDWASIVTSRRASPAVEEFVQTGIRSIDLFAPLRRGALVDLPPAYGLGQAIALFQIADHLRPVGFWHIGFEYGAYAAWHVEHGSRETGVPAVVRLVPPGGDAAERRKGFANALAELLDDRDEKLVVCQQVDGHAHDITLALPTLAADDSVLATFVTEPFTGEYPPVPREMPEGFDARIAFAKTRAKAGLWPAVDPHGTASRYWPSERHEVLAVRARSVLRAYEDLDPALTFPDPSTFADGDAATCAQALLRYLAQPMRVAELATAVPGERTTYAELLDEVEAIIGEG